MACRVFRACWSRLIRCARLSYSAFSSASIPTNVARSRASCCCSISALIADSKVGLAALSRLVSTTTTPTYRKTRTLDHYVRYRTERILLEKTAHSVLGKKCRAPGNRAACSTFRPVLGLVSLTMQAVCLAIVRCNTQEFPLHLTSRRSGLT